LSLSKDPGLSKTKAARARGDEVWSTGGMLN